MNKEYKKVYELVNKLNFTCDYIKFKYGIYTLNLYSKDFNCLGKGVEINLSYNNLERLKEEIVLNILKENDIFENEIGEIYTIKIKDGNLFFYNGVNLLTLEEINQDWNINNKEVFEE